MTSPSVVSTATTAVNSGTTNWSVNLPASLVLDNTVCVYLRRTTSNGITWPDGWNEFILADTDDSDDILAAAWWKVDDDELTTITVTMTAGAKGTAITRQYGGAADPATSPPEAATVTVGTDDSPDPGTVTPTGGSKDYLFEAVASMTGTPTVSAFPSGYTIDPTNEATSGGGAATNCRIAVAAKQATAASDNPGAYTYSGSAAWMATVVAIHPAAGGAITATGSLASGSAATSGAATRQTFASGAVAAQLASIVGAATGGSYAAHGIEFDGTNDYLTRGAGLTGAADGKTLTFSGWVKSGDETTRYVVNNTNETVRILMASTGIVQAICENAAGTVIANLRSNGTYEDSKWHHIAISFDLANASNRHLYVDDADDLNTGTITYTDDNIDYTVANWSIGAQVSGAGKAPMCVGELWFDDGYIDFSVEANRRKFISAAGATVNLGSDGSTPTGSSPLIYLGGNGQEADGWETNKGTGGGFTENGALTDCATDPLLAVLASGALKAQASATAGAAYRTAKASGSPTSQVAVMDGSATREALASGSIESAAAVTDGTATVGGAQLASGAVQSGLAVIDGAGVRGVNASGTLQSGFASIVGAVTRGAVSAVGSLASGAARIRGVLARKWYTQTGPGETWRNEDSGTDEAWYSDTPGPGETWRE